jgi:DNA-binding winged helix-turn-helix (wHTH) protein/class 3 adenylate cyclase
VDFRVTSIKFDGSEEISFGRFQLDLRRGELWHKDRLVRLGRRPLEILCVLASAGGSVVSKDELMEGLWPGRAVEEGNLHVHVSALRRALGDHGDGHSYIVTIPGRGYRLAGLGGSELTGLDELLDRQDLVPNVSAADTFSGSPRPAKARGVERRQLTVISAELAGAARLARVLDPEEFTTTVSAVHRCCSEVFARFGGNTIRIADGELLGYFGYPQSREHDAERAVRAGLAVRESFRSLDAPEKLRLQLGIATGPVVIGAEIGSEPSGLFGEAIGLAAALRRAAEPGSLLIANNTRRLVGRLFDLREREDLDLEGFEGPVEAYKVLRSSTLQSRFEALRGSLLTPLVGRDEEIEFLFRRWHHTKSGELRVVLITGEPGIGKSRMCVELQRRISQEPHICIQYFCSPHHHDSPLYPVIRQLEAAGSLEHSDPPDVKLAKLRALLDRETSAAHEDVDLLAEMLSVRTSDSQAFTELSAYRRRDLTFAALLRQLEALSLRHPVLIVFEDAQWSDPTTLELLDLVLRRAVRRPVLVLITFRSEFAAPWIGQSHVTTLTLNRLDRKEGAALVRWSLGEKALSNDVIEAIAERADGVPLFIEELSKTLAESDANVKTERGSEWSTGIPTTLQGSLLARLDRLPHAKQLAQVGAAIGREFAYGLVAEVSGMPGPQVEQGLQELTAAGLASVRGRPPGATYTFKHALVQDTAYESLLRSRRTEIHAGIVAACERIPYFNGDPGVLAHHCAQAGLIAKAAFYYRAAASRSIERAAITETRLQLQRGLVFAEDLRQGQERDQLEAELLLALATVLQTTESMSNAEAGQLFRRAAGPSRTLARPQLLSRALWGQFTNVLVRGEVVAARSLAEQLLDVAQAGDDVHTQLAARAAMGIALHYQGYFTTARQHLAIQQSILETQSEAVDLDWRTMTAGPAFLALTLACLGYPEQARVQLARAVETATSKGPFALAYCLSIAVRVLIVLRDFEGLRERTLKLTALSEEGRFHQFLNQGMCALGWLEIRKGASARGSERLRAALSGMSDLACLVSLPFYLSLLTDLPSATEDWHEKLTPIDEALELSGRTGDAWFRAELYRRRGELLIGPAPNQALAEGEFHRALEIAREQSAKLFELRCATSLARLWLTQGKRINAYNLLCPIYAWFTEGFGTPDLRDAEELMYDLAEFTGSHTLQ